jgi:hypothetical protein
MLQTVRDADGRLTPKHVIAERALNAVLDRLTAVTAGTDATRIDAGLVVFQGDSAEQVVRLKRFDSRPFRAWLAEKYKARAGTPLGEAVRVAGEALLQSRLPRKHVLVITDGVNTRGPDPAATIPRLQQSASRQESALAFHFIAFDVNSTEFAGVKKLGATVVGAVDEKQLNSQLEFIVAKKILLEDEEAPVVKPQTK